MGRAGGPMSFTGHAPRGSHMPECRRRRSSGWWEVAVGVHPADSVLEGGQVLLSEQCQVQCHGHHMQTQGKETHVVSFRRERSSEGQSA